MKKRALLTLIVSLGVLLLPRSAFALACVSNATGAWATAGSWTSCGGGVPGDGDTVTIGAHEITIAASTSVTVGTDPAALTAVITISNTAGILLVDDGADLTVKGSVAVNAGDFVLDPGSTLTLAGTNNQRIVIGATYDTSLSAADQFFQTNGTSGSRVTINQTGAGAKFITCSNGSDLPCRMLLNYTDVTLGTSTINAFYASIRSANDYWIMRNVTVANSGIVANITSPNVSSNFEFTNVTIKDTVDQNGWGFRMVDTTDGATGDRIIDGCVFDDPVRSEELRDFTITDTFFLGGMNSIATSGDTFTADGIIYWDTLGTEVNLPYSTMNNLLYVGNNAAKTNPHGLTGIGKNYDQTLTDSVFTCDWTDDDGDLILLATGATSNHTLTLTGNLFLPGPSGTNNGCGTVFSQLGNQYTQVSASHNTAIIKAQAAFALGETYTGRTGLILSLVDNIVANLNGSAGGYIAEDTGTNDSVTDLVADTDIDYNATFNLLGNTNQLEFTTPANVQANGVTGDPGFVDTGCRTLADYRDDVKSTTGSTLADVRAELLKKNDADWDADYELSSILTYFRGCWQPTNQDFKAASDSNYGGWMGAVEGPAASSSGNGLPLGGGMGIQGSSIQFSRTGVQ